MIDVKTKQKIFSVLNDYAKYDNLSTAIDTIKRNFKLNDNEFMPIYNEWFFGK